MRSDHQPSNDTHDGAAELDEETSQRLDQILAGDSIALHNGVIGFAHHPAFSAIYEYLARRGVPEERLIRFMTALPNNFFELGGRPSPLGRKLLSLVPSHWNVIIAERAQPGWSFDRWASGLYYLLIEEQPAQLDKIRDLLSRVAWRNPLSNLLLTTGGAGFAASARQRLEQPDLSASERLPLLRAVIAYDPQQFLNLIYAAAIGSAAIGQPQIQRRALQALYRLDADLAWPLLVSASDPGNEQQAAAAVQVLGSVEPERARPLLRRLVASDSRDIAMEAADTLLRSDWPGREREALELLGHRFRQVRQLAEAVVGARTVSGVTAEAPDDRSEVIAEIWEELGERPDNVAAMVEGEVWGKVAYEIAKLASNDIALFTAAWMRSRTSGGVDYVAYDLGDEYYYVRLHDDARETGTRIIVAVSKAASEVGFRTIQERAIAHDIPAFPDELRAHDLGKPWFTRAVVEAIESSGGWSIPEYLSVETDIAGQTDEGTREELLEWWESAVEQTPSIEEVGPPPGLIPLDTDSDEEAAFSDWIDQVEIRWTDTGVRLDPSTAATLRYVCQYFVSLGV